MTKLSPDLIRSCHCAVKLAEMHRTQKHQDGINIHKHERKMCDKKLPSARIPLPPIEKRITRSAARRVKPEKMWLGAKVNAEGSEWAVCSKPAEARDAARRKEIKLNVLKCVQKPRKVVNIMKNMHMRHSFVIFFPLSLSKWEK